MHDLNIVRGNHGPFCTDHFVNLGKGCLYHRDDEKDSDQNIDHLAFERACFITFIKVNFRGLKLRWSQPHSPKRASRAADRKSRRLSAQNPQERQALISSVARDEMAMMR